MEIHFVQNIDNTRVVKVADPRRRREERLMLLAGALLFLMFFSYAWQRFQLVRVGYRMEQARAQEAQLEQWNRGLQLEEASLRDPNRIFRIATVLGLQTARPEQMVALTRSDSSTGSPAVAELTTHNER